MLARLYPAATVYYRDGAQNWAQWVGVNPSVETVWNWVFPSHSSSSLSGWHWAGEAELLSDGGLPFAPADHSSSGGLCPLPLTSIGSRGGRGMSMMIVLPRMPIVGSSARA